jgi:glutamate carboxypeptidase
MNRVFVLEPSLDPDGKIKTRRKGVGHFDVIIKGISSHAGIEPEKGRSAILELSYLIQKLHQLNDPENGVSVNVGTIDGGISTNVVAPESHASVDVRVKTKADAKRLKEKITSMDSDTEGVTLEIRGGFRRPPLVQNKRNRALWNTAKEIGHQLGLELTQGTSGGGSDGSYTSLYTATLDGMGAVGDGAHSPTERIFLHETLERIPLIVNLLLQPPVNN